MKLLHSLPFLGLSLSSVALANSGFFYLNQKHPVNPLAKRQTEFCGQGVTCADACGAGYEQCGTSSSNCYNPTAGDTCCGDSGYSCSAGEYCADSEGDCCDNGQDLGTCTSLLGITLSPSAAGSTTYIPSATYIPSTTDIPITTDIPNTTYIPSSTPEPGSVTTSTYVPPIEPTLPTSSSTPVGTSSATSPVFTGAAMKIDVGVTGKLLAAVLGLAGAL